MSELVEYRMNGFDIMYCLNRVHGLIEWIDRMD